MFTTKVRIDKGSFVYADVFASLFDGGQPMLPQCKFFLVGTKSERVRVMFVVFGAGWAEELHEKAALVGYTWFLCGLGCRNDGTGSFQMSAKG